MKALEEQNWSLGRLPVFRDLPEMALNELQAMAREWTFKNGDILWGRKVVRGFFVILRGSVKVELDGGGRGNGPKALLYVLGAGEFCRETGILNRRVDSCIVTAVGSGKALLFSAAPARNSYPACPLTATRNDFFLSVTSLF